VKRDGGYNVADLRSSGADSRRRRHGRGARGQPRRGRGRRSIPRRRRRIAATGEGEREADDYAIKRLHAAGLPLAPPADLLQKLEAAHAERAKGGGGRSVGMDGYLSTHPATDERIRKLREGL